MKRYQPPYNGKRYILDTYTGIAHDLNEEKPECRIDDIEQRDIYASNFLFGDIKEFLQYRYDCEHCMKDKNAARSRLS